nr:reverse transcriptase domain-containing protein [Tanacetum cinerariifolium]
MLRLKAVVDVSTPISAAKPAAKPKFLKIVAAALAVSTRKRKGVVIRDPEEELHDDTLAETLSVKDKGKGILVEDIKPMKKKDQIEMDAEYERKLQEEEESFKKVDWNTAFDHVQAKDVQAKGIQYIKRYHGFKKKPQSESEARKNMIAYLKNTEEMEKEEEEIIKSINETPAQKVAKRRRLREQAKEDENLKKQLELEVVVDEDDDVFIEATPIGRNVPVVNYKIMMINNKPRMEALSESKGSVGGNWKSRSKKQSSSIKDDDISQSWVCEETDLFTPRVPYFDLSKWTRMPSHVKTYNGSEDPKDHLKNFQAAAKAERWSMPTWCHMFNSTLTESARREGESTKGFVRRFKIESRDVKGAPEIMRISRFMHGITNPELIKHLHDKISKSVDKMMITTSFHRGRWQLDMITLLSKSLQEILALEKGKVTAPPPMTTSVKKRNNNKFYEFHREVRHNTDECMHLKRQIEELLKNGKLSHVIKELKQNSRKNQPKANKKGKHPKSDGSGHCPLNRIQWRNHMAIRATVTTSEIGDEEHSTSAWMNFLVVRSSSSYNEIIRRPRVRKIQAVPSTTHGMIKFPIVGGVLILRSSKIILIECAAVSGPEEQSPDAHQAIEERIKPADMTGIPRHIVERQLNIREGCPPVKQKRKIQAADRNQEIQEEVEKLIDAGIMKEVHYHSWLSNSVMVKKHEDSWRMCVDFKDPNKSCPKDSYSLPKIDWKMKRRQHSSQAKEYFATQKMPFDLRNAGATYQRLVDKAFHKQIGKNLEVQSSQKFVWDNIVCRFGLPEEIISDIGKQFRDNPIKDWCEKLCICQRFASVKHLQTNGLVERANRSLGEGIKARLDARWMEKIPHVLWAHRTMIKSSNEDTPFSLTYGTKAVTLAEIGMPTPRTAEVDVVQNNEALGIILDLLE